ncbi:MAG: hypothetical protein KGZ25_14695, partial [Planctomycetes bacterium]|nr:hypothetical protein [Planctomycetota bacterium]
RKEDYRVAKMKSKPNIDGRHGDWKAIPDMQIQRNGSPRNATARLAFDAKKLYLLMTVKDPSPWVNNGKDFTRLFKTGDAVDVQLCINPSPKRRGRQLLEDDRRILLAPYQEGEAVVLMQPVAPDAPDSQARTYESPIMTKNFDRVVLLKSAETAVRKEGRSYTVEMGIPLADIGLQIKGGLKLRGDVGFISSNANGTANVARTYWSNKHTNLVNDLPSEALLYPKSWGVLEFE